MLLFRLRLGFLSCIVMAFGVDVETYAQESSSLLFLDLAPNHQEVLLADQPVFGHIGLPGISNVSVQGMNSMFHPSKWLVDQGPNQSAALSLDAIWASVQSNPRFGIELKNDWINVGWHNKKRRSFFSLAVTEEFGLDMTLPGDLIRLPFTGNAGFELMEDARLDLTDLRLDIVHARSYGMGWQQRWSDQWSTGIRLRYIDGLQHASVAENYFSLETDPETWSLHMTGGGQLQSSGWMYFLDSTGANSTEEQIRQLMASKGNHGFGLDFGIKRQVSERLEIHLQFKDLGWIDWKKDVSTWSIPESEWSFDGVVSDAGYDDWTNDSLTTWGEALLSTWGEALQPIESQEVYRSNLRTTWQVACAYSVIQSKKHEGKLGFTAHASPDGDHRLIPNWRLSYNHQWGRAMGLSFTWGASNGWEPTAGIGCVLHLGPLSLVAGVDNIVAARFTRFIVPLGSEEPNEPFVESSFLLPTSAEVLQVQLGVQWRLGWRTPRNRKQNPEPMPYATPSSSRAPMFSTESQ